MKLVMIAMSLLVMMGNISIKPLNQREYIKEIANVLQSMVRTANVQQTPQSNNITMLAPLMEVKRVDYNELVNWDCYPPDVYDIIDETVTVGDRGVSVRSGPGTTYTEIGKLHAGTRVTVQDVATAGNGTWYVISYRGGYGWISAGYVVLH